MTVSLSSLLITQEFPALANPCNVLPNSLSFAPSVKLQTVVLLKGLKDTCEWELPHFLKQSSSLHLCFSVSHCMAQLCSSSPELFLGMCHPGVSAQGHRALALTAAARGQVHRHPDLPSVSNEGLNRFWKGWVVIVRCEFARRGW